jgi:hypothetical protein
MYCSQLAKVDHMYKNMWAGGRKKILGEGSLGHLRVAGRGCPIAGRGPGVDCRLRPAI